MAAFLLCRAAMRRTRHRRASAPRSTTVVARAFAAWLILLTMLPFTAPFTVCSPSDLSVADASLAHTTSPDNGVGAWGMDQGVVADLPAMPMAQKIAATSVSIAAVDAARGENVATGHVPFVPLLLSAEQPLIVLRV